MGGDPTRIHAQLTSLLNKYTPPVPCRHSVCRLPSTVARLTADDLVPQRLLEAPFSNRQRGVLKLLPEVSQTEACVWSPNI